MKDFMSCVGRGARGLLLTMTAVAGLGFGTQVLAQAESSDPIKLAVNEWTAASVINQIAEAILVEAGYKVEKVSAGYLTQFTALEDGGLTASLEIWNTTAGEHWPKALATGKVIPIGALGLDPIEGWVYPEHLEEVCPGLPDWQAFKNPACVEALATPETFPKGRLLDYPADWFSGNDKKVPALELDLDVQPGGSEGAMAAEFKAAVAKKSPLVMQFWAPHWLISENDVGWVALPKGEPACHEDPSWGPNPNAVDDCGGVDITIEKTVWIGMEEKWPVAFRILKQFEIDNDSYANFAKEVDVNKRSVEDVANDWLKANEATWKGWIETAQKG